MKKLLLAALTAVSLFGADYMTCEEKAGVYQHFQWQKMTGGGSQRAYFYPSNPTIIYIQKDTDRGINPGITIKNKTGRTLIFTQGFNIQRNQKIRLTNDSQIDFIFNRCENFKIINNSGVYELSDI